VLGEASRVLVLMDIRRMGATEESIVHQVFNQCLCTCHVLRGLISHAGVRELLIKLEI